MGNDFGTFGDYLDAIVAGESSSGTTWRNLLNVLNEAGVDPEECFFPNAIPGLRTQGKNTDPSPAMRHHTFVGAAAQFIKAQMLALRPNGIVLLGSVSHMVFGRLCQGEGIPFSSDRVSIRKWGIQAPEPMPISIGGYQSSLVRLVHPSTRHWNLRLRKPPAGVSHEAFKVKLLRALASRPVGNGFRESSNEFPLA